MKSTVIKEFSIGFLCSLNVLTALTDYCLICLVLYCDCRVQFLCYCSKCLSAVVTGIVNGTKAFFDLLVVRSCK